MASAARKYQSQIFAQDALENSESQPVLLSSIEVNGGDNVSRQLFSKLLSPLMERSDYTLGQLVKKLEEGTESLEKIGIFESVRSSLHVDYVHSVPDKKSYNKDEPIVSKVVYDLNQKQMSGGALAIGSNDEDNLIVDLGYMNNNFNHNAEMVKIGVSYRPYKPNERLKSKMNIEAKLRNPAFKFVLDLFNTHENNQGRQQKTGKASGGLIGIKYLNSKNFISAFGGISLIKRSAGNAGSDEYEVAGRGICKTSAVAGISYDSTAMVNSFLGEGLRIACKSQIFGYETGEEINHSKTSFVKGTLAFDHFKSFSPAMLTSHLFSEVGFIFASSSRDMVCTSDRFQLGGFNSFRGFTRNGVDEKGGLQYYKAGATVYGIVPSTLLPNSSHAINRMRLYGTGMIGNVGDNILHERGAFSAGFGLKYVNQMVRFDMGYYLSRRFDSVNSNGIKDGFKLEMCLGGAEGAS